MGAKSKKIVIPVILFSVIIVALCLVLGLANMQPNGPISTEERAVEIALPIVQTYAQENNRTITTTKTTLRESARPYWLVEIGLKDVENPNGIYHLRTTSYEVTMWADTGEIYHHGSIWAELPYNEEKFKIPIDIAIEIAYPFAQKYAQENNLTITTTNSWTGEEYSRPAWMIDIQFDNINQGFYSYCIFIWGDTGEIRWHREQGWYS